MVSAIHQHESTIGIHMSPISLKEWHSTPVFLPGEFRGQRSLAGYIQGVTKNWTWLEQLLFAPKMCCYGKNAKFRVRDLGLSSRSHIHDLRYYFNSCTEFHLSSLLKNRVSINHIKGSTGRLNKITCRAPSIYVVHVRHLVSKWHIFLHLTNISWALIMCQTMF